MNSGFILLHRRIVDWEWYQNPNTFRVFLHCLLKANFTDGRFEGVDVKRGEFVTSLPSLAKQTSLTIQQVRTALAHLKSTGEITDKAFSKYRVITVCKYDVYQTDNRQSNSQSTGNQQADNRQATVKQQQYKKNNNDNKKNNENNFLPFLGEEEAAGIQADHDHVLDAAKNAGFKCSPSECAGLLNLYAAYGLEKVVSGIDECVKHSATNLAYLDAVIKGKGKKTSATDVHGYEQRDYSGEQEAAMRRMMADEWEGSG